jgi:hypothetical protein
VAAIVRCSSSSWCSQQSFPVAVHPVVPKHSVMDSKVDVVVAVAVDAVVESSCYYHSIVKAAAVTPVASACCYWYCYWSCAEVLAALSFLATLALAFLAVPKSPGSQPRDRRHCDYPETIALADANANANFDFDIRAAAVASDPWKWDGGVGANWYWYWNWNAIDSVAAVVADTAHIGLDSVAVPLNCCEPWAIRAPHAAWENAHYRETKRLAPHVAAAVAAAASAENIVAVAVVAAADAGRVFCSPTDCGVVVAVVAVDAAASAVGAAAAVANGVGAVVADLYWNAVASTGVAGTRPW